MSESTPKIKSITRFTMPYALMHTDSHEDARFKSYTEIYDEQGNQVEQVKYNPDGSEDERAIFKYDGKDRLLEESVTYALSENPEIRKIEYDDSKHISVDTQYYGNEPGEQIITRHNEDGDIMVEKHTDEEGDLLSVHTFEYYKKGLVSEERKLNSDGNLIKKITYTYDENDRLKGQEIESNDEHTPNQKIAVKREEGKEILESMNDKEQIFQRQVRKFNEKGRMVEFVNEDFAESHNNLVQKLEYDDRDNIITNEVFDMNGNLIRKQEFVYDEENRLKEEIFFHNNFFGGNEHTHTKLEYEYFGQKAL